jgi:hypothetical protein
VVIQVVHALVWWCGGLEWDHEFALQLENRPLGIEAQQLFGTKPGLAGALDWASWALGNGCKGLC